MICNPVCNFLQLESTVNSTVLDGSESLLS